jgi:hypothetical protein
MRAVAILSVKNPIAFLAIALFVALATCSSIGCSSGDITSPEQIVFPASNVSYHAQVAPYLALSCNSDACHGGVSGGGSGIMLTSWAQVLDNRVTLPRDTTSPIVLVLYGLEPNHRGAFIASDNQRQGIKTWVKEGAQNN